MGTGKDRGGGKDCVGVRACVLQIRRCGNQSGVSMETLGEETRIASLLKSFCGKQLTPSDPLYHVIQNKLQQ